MALKKGVCKNFENCTLADKNEIQEVDSSEFKCSECGKELHEIIDNGHRPFPPKIIIIILSIVLLAAAVVIGIMKQKKGGEQSGITYPEDTLVAKRPPIVSLPPNDTIRDTIRINDTTLIVVHDTKVKEAAGNKGKKNVIKANNSNLSFGILDGSLSYDNNATIKVTKQHTMYLKDAKQSTIVVTPGDELRQCRIRNGILESFQVIRQDGNRESILDAQENLK